MYNNLVACWLTNLVTKTMTANTSMHVYTVCCDTLEAAFWGSLCVDAIALQGQDMDTDTK